MKIISGGLTGVDRAALDVAIKLNIEHGGWCPKGRIAEKGGIIPLHYQLEETKSSNYEVRTKLNIEDADGTLIIVPDVEEALTDGTALTLDYAKKIAKPHLVVDARDKTISSEHILEWLQENVIVILNVAGPRESKSPGIYERTCELLDFTFNKISNTCES